ATSWPSGRSCMLTDSTGSYPPSLHDALPILHLSTLENFRMPGDTSSSSRYWDEDIVEEPLEAVDGVQKVPMNGPGIGVTLRRDLVHRLTVRHEVLTGA